MRCPFDSRMWRLACGAVASKGRKIRARGVAPGLSGHWNENISPKGAKHMAWECTHRKGWLMGVWVTPLRGLRIGKNGTDLPIPGLRPGLISCAPSGRGGSLPRPYLGLTSFGERTQNAFSDKLLNAQGHLKRTFKAHRGAVAPRNGYRWRHTGVRFSTKARMPSCASSARQLTAMASLAKL